jgi:hypothetical protein
MKGLRLRQSLRVASGKPSKNGFLAAGHAVTLLNDYRHHGYHHLRRVAIAALAPGVLNA